MKKWLIGGTLAVSIAIIVAFIAPDVATSFAWTFLGIVLLIVSAFIGYLVYKRISAAKARSGGHQSTSHATHTPAATHGGGHGGGHGIGAWGGAAIALLLVCLIWWHFSSSSGVIKTKTIHHSSVASYEPPPVDPSCIMTTQPQFCQVKVGGQALVLAPGLHEGMTFCITPGVDESKLPEEQRIYKSVTRILKSGESPAYDHDHLETNSVIGYVLVPKKPIIVRQFMAETPDAAGC